MKNHPSEEKKKIEDQEENQEKRHDFQEEREKPNSLGNCSNHTCAFIAAAHVGLDLQESGSNPKN